MTAPGDPLARCFPFRRESSAAKGRLLCLPYAGGGAVAHRSWGGALAPAIEVCAFEPPGRNSRFDEEPFRKSQEYAEALAAIIARLSDKPFAIFGHSLGAMVAFTVAQHLQRQGARGPVAIFLSGHGLRDKRREPIHRLPTPELIEKLRTYEGTLPEILENRELMELVLPAIRADFGLVDEHRYELGIKISCPVMALGGEEDPEVTKESLLAWREQTTGAFALRMFPGGHFYLRRREPEVLKVVREFLGAWRSPS